MDDSYDVPIVVASLVVQMEYDEVLHSRASVAAVMVVVIVVVVVVNDEYPHE